MSCSCDSQISSLPSHLRSKIEAVSSCMHCVYNSKNNSTLMLGAIHSTRISGNFRLKLNGSVRCKRKSSEKIRPSFEVDHCFSQLDRFYRNGPFHLTIPNPSSNPGPRCSISSMCKMEENTYHVTALSWIVNSRSIIVTRTSTLRSVAASLAKCMFWLFPREFGMFFSSFDPNVAFEVTYGKYLGKVCSK